MDNADPDLTLPTKVPSDSLGRIGSLKRTSGKSLFPTALGSCCHRITHQLRPINMNGRSILSVMSLRRQIMKNPLEQGHGTQSNPLCMKDLWPSASQFWKIIPDLKTVNNPDPDSFRPQNQRKRAQNPQ